MRNSRAFVVSVVSGQSPLEGFPGRGFLELYPLLGFSSFLRTGHLKKQEAEVGAPVTHILRARGVLDWTPEAVLLSPMFPVEGPLGHSGISIGVAESWT
jgi:hypothetical protein